jgi:sugar lactone lactonase YvrE
MNNLVQRGLRLAGVAAIAAVALVAADPYVSEGLLAIPSTVQMGAVSAVEIDAQGRIYVLHRGEPPVLAFDRDGRYTHGFGNGLFKVAHGLRIDRSGDVWTTDNGRHVLRKFSPDGKLLATYGVEDTPGDGAKHFRSPDDLVFATDGSI